MTLAADVGGNPQAPAVILLHGGGQTRHSWDGAMGALLDHGYHVVNFDARGHGESDWSPRQEYTLEALADDLRAVIDSLPAPPALVGASMGGMTALHAIARESAAIARALIMVDVVPHLRPEGVARIVSFLRANQQGFATIDDAADAVSAYNPHRPRPQDPSGLAKNLRRRANGRLHWHWDPAFFSENRNVPFVAGANHPSQFQNVRLPVLLVRGMQSDLVTDAGVEHFRGLLPALDVFDVSGAGHMVVGDRNDAFNQAILAYLERHMPI
jgi:pimeloyl-ACP methyl ester carboxylesterase